jgi:hypothetical protein
MLRHLAFVATFLVLTSQALPAGAACLDVHQSGTITFGGILTYHIFAGPPNFEDVRRGDTPEPSYILQLDDPICATGDDFLDPKEKIDRIQVFPDQSGAASAALQKDLRGLVGRHVTVAGASAFGAHTGHHHAPLLLAITQVTSAADPTDAYGTAMTTVQAFYLALAAGNGEEAARFVVPEKSVSGPLSAAAMTKFYGGLSDPLTLIDVVPVRSDEYRVRYTFVASGAQRCDGAAIVRTASVKGANLIASIKARSGC